MPKIVQKIAKPYISDDCIQVMIHFTNAMTILNEEGILFHQKNDSNLLYINKYIEDERRKQFPYSNIPFHNVKNGLNKMVYTNQLLEYEKPYIKISDGNLTENYVLKDQSNVFLIESKMEINKNTKCMTYEEFLKFISPQNTEEEQTFYVYIDGTIPLPDDPNSLFPFRDIKKAMSNFIQTKLA